MNKKIVLSSIIWLTAFSFATANNNLEWKRTTDDWNTIRCIYISMDWNDVWSINIDWWDWTSESALITNEENVSVVCHQYLATQNFPVKMEGTTSWDDFNYIWLVDQHVTEVTAWQSDTLDYFVVQENKNENKLPASTYNNMVWKISWNHWTVENIIPAQPTNTNTNTSNTNNSWWWGWWWWGWWWGWDNYSCKNLPTNATANNKITPKSDINYSYSTNTSKECTFQCNKGYTRNETNKKCEGTWTNNTTWDIKTETKIDTNNKDIIKSDNGDKSRYEEWDQSEILENGYSREFNNAYTFAYKNWITTMDDISKANMDWPLTRIAMAKMLSNYAINVLGKKPANIIVPKFPDVSEELNEEYGWAVTLAYQLGIMWIWIENFRPNDFVTRAEFGTALSRMLYGLEDWTDSYYTTHLAKLKAEWIIANDDPALWELRWYVMLMLMRSAIK